MAVCADIADNHSRCHTSRMLTFKRSVCSALALVVMLVAPNLTQSAEWTRLFAMVAAAREAPPRSGAFKLLIIQVPDQVMGGKGRIHGTGEQPKADGVAYSFHLVDIVRRCGANFPMVSSNWSHRTDIISWSTAQDREVVSCLRSKFPTDFNAGLANPSPRGGYTADGRLATLDTAPFREFEQADAPR